VREIVVMAEAIKDIQRLEITHGVHEVHFGFFRALSQTFPFGIYYRDTSERTQVFAVLDLRRSPDWASKQLMRR
jgi:hypothetical protein